ncbi:alpha-L-rhamnosidase [Gracilibacillus orientalis]|uniref:Alpha-L-rhamnosidase n=1 Tax=Gracilibacillus orientalis TaxID=334253 RepID=A0A1I4J022_9BACI|nr:family 78 glycoside hydrolase catalytic domain [Gracilibacillus orientalis]SFL59563.1 alpha-L-rhamnosidase [Gracilibacillus orientalis]
MNIQKAENRLVIENEFFKHKAKALKPELNKKLSHPISSIETVRDNASIHGWKSVFHEKAEELKSKSFEKGESFILDFGTHHVGYLSLDIEPVGSPPDAPLHMRLTLGEMPIEVSEPFSEYDGWISSSWLQEETFHVDILPSRVDLPRRYSFRYVKVEILDTSPKYNVSFKNVICNTVTSADSSKLVSLTSTDDKEIEKIDEVSIKTLQDCMQDVFEDGPKRDRRLWLGDLRLQALANYETFQNNDLVKRCLYLFAALPNEKGQIAANLFIEPKLIPDDTYLFDYSLFFTTTLHDYYQATKDNETLEDLWPMAHKQIELALARLDEKGIVKDDESWWSFIDWNDDLNKQAPSQAVLIYAMKKAQHLARILEDKDKVHNLELKIQAVTHATTQHLWDEELEFFVSGANRQVSWASQVWMVIAGVFDSEKNREIMDKLFEKKPNIVMNTPYMYHHLVEALLQVGNKQKAVSVIKQYWGGMIKDGADTFWELYNLSDKNYSPYGSHLINSYCHAWSCTPTYLIRKYRL